MNKQAHDCANFGKKNHNSQLSIRTREKYYKQPATTLSNFKQTALSTRKSRVLKVGIGFSFASYSELRD